MQPKSAIKNTREEKAIELIDRNSDKLNIRIGAYYTKLKTNQKSRFNSIVKSITTKLEVTNRHNPMEMLLVRQIALNTIRIEEAELDVMEGHEEKYLAAIEKWLFNAQKERRDAMTTLSTILKVNSKKGGVGSFTGMRSALRSSENLPESELTETPPDSHDRRYHDEITRTTE